MSVAYSWKRRRASSISRGELAWRMVTRLRMAGFGVGGKSRKRQRTGALHDASRKTKGHCLRPFSTWRGSQVARSLRHDEDSFGVFRGTRHLGAAFLDQGKIQSRDDRLLRGHRPGRGTDGSRSEE